MRPKPKYVDLSDSEDDLPDLEALSLTECLKTRNAPLPATAHTTADALIPDSEPEYSSLSECDASSEAGPKQKQTIEGVPKQQPSRKKRRITIITIADSSEDESEDQDVPSIAAALGKTVQPSPRSKAVLKAIAHKPTARDTTAVVDISKVLRDMYGRSTDSE